MLLRFSPIIGGFAREHASHGERDQANGERYRQKPERGLIQVVRDVGVKNGVVEAFHVGRERESEQKGKVKGRVSVLAHVG